MKTLALRCAAGLASGRFRISEDYALIEYGVTEAELKRAVRNINRQARYEKTKRWDGTANGLRD